MALALLALQQQRLVELERQIDRGGERAVGHIGVAGQGRLEGVDQVEGHPASSVAWSRKGVSYCTTIRRCLSTGLPPHASACSVRRCPPHQQQPCDPTGSGGKHGSVLSW